MYRTLGVVYRRGCSVQETGCSVQEGDVVDPYADLIEAELTRLRSSLTIGHMYTSLYRNLSTRVHSAQYSADVSSLSPPRAHGHLH